MVGYPFFFTSSRSYVPRATKKRTLHACATSISHALEEGSGCIGMEVQYKTLGSKA